jgi:hypothetical protein
LLEIRFFFVVSRKLASDLSEISTNFIWQNVMQLHRQRLMSIALLAISLVGADLTASNSHAQKPLAPGVLKTVPGNLDPRDSFSLPMILPGINVQPYEANYISPKDTLHHMTRRVVMFRDVWEYEFSFLGLRQAKLMVPDLKTGTPQSQNVWYLIYRIRDLGSTLTYEQVKQSPDFDHLKYDLKRDQAIAAEEKFFLPRFILEGSVITDAKDGYQRIIYRDKVSPMVLRQIQRREDPGLKLLDSVEMSKTAIPLAKTDADGGVWGVAVFENVDPRIDYVSVFVTGLTNAFRLDRDSEQPNHMKTLQLNFWRPGDIVSEENDRITYGIPFTDNPQKQVLITQRYELPGPVVRGYHINRDAANLPVLTIETDAMVSLKTFDSEVTPILDSGKLTEEIIQAFGEAGFKISPQTVIKTVVPGKRWSFTEGEDQFKLALEPQFWEPDQGKIRFIKSLDHLWIYR